MFDHKSQRIPFKFMVPAQTVESTCFDTGNDSPVKAFSSTSHDPCTTIPSIGITSPALTASFVLTATSLALTSSPLLANTAFCGAMFINDDITAVA
ncbi:hypothetical protein M8C21_014042 [Ambrosia artemisiifolia]|uniref:Uncharacterized protein n=1 Tax=Ambrosia artemisiifolia TaxID=4212 RepID=A0AAD5CRR1_AMBAR|nr:hypothetical protein M8C21_014042 [Ambrosia artemisiifolia]